MAQQTASVTMSGTPEKPIFNFVLPTGAKGEPGGWNNGVGLGDTKLNTITTPGLYNQTEGAYATAANDYPAMSGDVAQRRGTLEVMTWGGGPNTVIQRYTAAGSRSIVAKDKPRVTYMRWYLKNGTPTEWSAWSAFTPSISDVDASGQRTVSTWDDTGNAWVALAGPGGLTAPVKLTHTTDLNTLFTPGIYSATSAAVPNLPLAVSGTLTITARYMQGEMYGPSITQHFVPFFGVPAREGQVEYRRTFTGDAWQPWRSYVAQRVDNTAGRTIYTWDDTTNREQMIYGDTGWRTVSASTAQQPIWSTTTLRLRRVGNLVDFVFLGTGPIDPAVLGLDIQGFRAIHADDIPSAFRPSANAYNMGFGRFTQASGSATPRQYVMCVMNASGGMHFEKDETAPNGVLLSASSSIYVSGCYTTNSAWPTILPGTASA